MAFCLFHKPSHAISQSGWQSDAYIQDSFKLKICLKRREYKETKHPKNLNTLEPKPIKLLLIWKQRQCEASLQKEII